MIVDYKNDNQKDDKDESSSLLLIPTICWGLYMQSLINLTPITTLTINVLLLSPVYR